MNTNDDRIRNLLKESRPEAALPPGFQNAVWRRIEQRDESPVGLGVWGFLTRWLMSPRTATAALATVALLGALAGTLHGMKVGNELAKERYVASVDPALFRQ